MGLARVDINHNESAAAKQPDPSVRPFCPPRDDRFWVTACRDLPISDALDCVGPAWKYSPAAAGILQREFKHRLSPRRGGETSVGGHYGFTIPCRPKGH